MLKEPPAYHCRRNGEPLPGSYLDRIERPLATPS